MLGFVEGEYFLHQREMNAMHIYLLEMTAYKITHEKKLRTSEIKSLKMLMFLKINICNRIKTNINLFSNVI